MQDQEAAEVYQGVVIFFSNKKGYGFIEWSLNGTKQKDLFVHYSDLVCLGFKTVNKDDRVSFSIGQNNKGQPKAINVVVIK